MRRLLLAAIIAVSVALLASAPAMAVNVNGQNIVFAPSGSHLEYNFTTAHDFSYIDVGVDSASFEVISFAGNVSPVRTLRITLITVHDPVDFRADVGANYSALWVNVSGLSNGKYAYFFNDVEKPGTRRDITDGGPFGVADIVTGSNDFKVVRVGFADTDLALLILLGLLFILLLIMGFVFEPWWHFLDGIVGLFLALQMWEMLKNAPLTGIMAVVAIGVMLSGVFRPGGRYVRREIDDV